ncbi:hypothetical protein [uncultured Chloroflexus sp.]|uniref:putative iron-sulfur cluster-binding metallochaperone n=1 Tax=uncultured Chloroflexus sp. TaxID=214040 RepID=UPI0026079DBF|nr:hypothetical protein [uncultured Chloroflexus sp.]
MRKSRACSSPAETTSHETHAQLGLCPACGAKGVSVSIQTVKVMAAISLRWLRSTSYQFCHTPHCPVVYYCVADAQTLTVDQVRERVYQKETDQSNVFICYCFRYRASDLQQATAAEYEAIIADIRAGIAAGQCACELRNPQGSCCLGNVYRALRDRG